LISFKIVIVVAFDLGFFFSIFSNSVEMPITHRKKTVLSCPCYRYWPTYIDPAGTRGAVNMRAFS
jgi:hypothetical protein